MREMVNTLGGSKVEVGHFKEQGLHYSGLTYPELMYIHHTGSNSGSGGPLVRRPVLDKVFLNNKNLNDSRIKAAVTRWKKRPPSEMSTNKLLKEIAQRIAKLEKDVIGNPKELTVTANPTPLRDTGDLKDNVAYRINSGDVKVA